MSFTLHEVTYTYPRAKEPALRDLSLVIPAGQTTAILGPSGSGKTTLLNLLGLLWEGAPAAGHVVYDGDRSAGPRDYAVLSASARTELRLREFGFVLQSSYLLPHFTCSQNVAMPLAIQGRDLKEGRAAVERLLRLADPGGQLLEVRDRLAGEVSGGQKQRMAVLRAVIHNPAVIFADEPISNLDPANARQVLDLLQAWRDGRLHLDAPPRQRTLVLVCHSLRTARRADHFVLLDRGRLAVEPFGVAVLPGRRAELHRLFEEDPTHDDP
jgi:ABC-type lipoprotein export system ATPase subunit